MRHYFRCSSQIFVKCVVGGCEKTIKFGLMDGGSYYVTRDEAVVEQIRKHKMFRLGKIRETIEEDPVQEEQVAEQSTVQNEQPNPIKTKLVGKRFLSTVQEDQNPKESASTPAEDADNRVQEDAEQASMEVDDIHFYLEAKNYLKNVLHVEPQLISTKQKTQDYCAEHGIVFPNLKW